MNIAPTRQLIGVALGSGVGRGWAHVGVLRRLEAAGLKPDVVCGTSIGALIGATYLAGRLDELEAWARGLNKSRMMRLFDFHMGAGGVIAGRRITQILHPDLHRLTIEELDRPFIAVAADLSTGQEVWVRRGPLVDAIRASYAIPGLFPPVRHDGHWLIDGALVNPIPVSVCRALGAHVTIAVNLNADPFGETPLEDDALDDIEDDGAEVPDLTLEKTGFVRYFFQRRRDEPSVFTVVARALTLVQDRIARSRLVGDPPDIMISPKLGDIGLFEFFRAADSILAGEEAAERAIPAIRAALRHHAEADSFVTGGRRRNGKPKKAAGTVAGTT
ncbi:MAG TPA: patatin-like phospholipase family protein [Stellaceae bacterium]|jgi:NTE family protein|nr:patatin-like phospholipase family protein [Stellaceae bacterium]